MKCCKILPINLNTLTMRVLHFISRLITGIVFIFSGFVKGIDPLGMAYRLEDYFIAWNAEWMMPLALTLSILLSTMEFVMGVVVLFNLKPKVNAWLLLGIMGFFTVLTFFDAIYNPVPDCGCFGDAITLTNWQTFYKNVVLMVFTIILFIWRNKTKDHFGNLFSYGTALVAALLFIGLSLYCYRHLPLMDFMDWKTGNKMYVENPEPVRYYLTYRNKYTDEIKEYLSPDYPYDDTIWMSQWEFVEQRVEDPNTFHGHDLQIMDFQGDDYTEIFIRNPDYQFLLVCWDLEESAQKGLQKAAQLAVQADEAGYSFIGLTSTLEPEVDSIKTALNLNFDFFQADDIALKTMVRANPGLLLMKDGIVIDKWHYNDFPTFAEFEKKFVENQ